MRDLLKKYGILESAVVAGTAAADAQVIYTDLDPETLLIPGNTFDLDLNGDNKIDVSFTGGSMYYYAAELNINGGEIVATSDSLFPLNIGYEDIISSGMNFISSAPYSDKLFFGFASVLPSSAGSNMNFDPESDTKFVGIRFTDTLNNPFYGWVRVEYDVGIATLRIKDYAYESTSGVGIMLPKDNRNTIHGSIYADINENCSREVGEQIGRAHVWTPVTATSRMPASAWKKNNKMMKKTKCITRQRQSKHKRYDY